MARKTNGTTTTTRRKNAAADVPPAVEAQLAPEISNEAPREVPKNGKPGKVVPINLEEQIRRRAYELYLQRRAAGESESGNESQDWLMAEREIRARLGGQEQALGAAVGQIRR
ncbi:MAG: DUF2934 domain-containing protein [Terriglobales bacterium]|jgi:hypothetical protein